MNTTADAKDGIDMAEIKFYIKKLVSKKFLEEKYPFLTFKSTWQNGYYYSTARIKESGKLIATSYKSYQDLDERIEEYLAKNQIEAQEEQQYGM